MHCSRRSALRWIGTAAGLTASAGCLDFGSSSGYTLVAQEINRDAVGDEFLVSDPSSVSATTRIDFATETKQLYAEELFETGSVTVHQWPLVAQDAWGTRTRPRSTFVRRDGTYYEVRVENDRRVSRNRWLFAVERTDSMPPDDARVVSHPGTSLSEGDRQILDAALDAVYADNDGFLGDPEFDGLQAVEYHQDLSVDDSDLVPDPPFDFVQAEDDYFRVVTDQRSVSIPEWTYSTDQIATSPAEFETAAKEIVPDARLQATTLSEDAREVLDTAVDGNQPYEEEDPLSDGLSTVLDELGIGSDLQPLDAYDDQTAFRWVVATYDDAWYRFDLLASA